MLNYIIQERSSSADLDAPYTTAETVLSKRQDTYNSRLIGFSKA